MRSIATALVVTVLAGAAYGQAASVLLEACNALQDPAKRLECLRAAVQGGGEATRSNAKEEALINAFEGMNGKLDVGISLINYQSALLDLGRELAVYGRDAAQEKRPAIAKLEEAVDTYKDAATFWSAAITFYARRGNSTSYFGGLPVDQVGLRWMVSKHDLPLRKSDLLGIWAGVSPDAGRQTMWLKARRLTEEGFALLKSAPKPESNHTATPASEHQD